MLEFNVAVRFPAAPLLTVILALVGKLILLILLVFYLYLPMRVLIHKYLPPVSVLLEA